MTDSVCIDWKVPSEEWNRFKNFVEIEFGSVEGYAGREAENAMREYAGIDGYETIESKIDRLVEAAGRRPTAPSNKRKFTHNSSGGTRVQARVDKEVKDEFRKVAKQGDNRPGIEFAKAISIYREGGRSQRLEKKLDRIIDDAESLLSEIRNEQTQEKLGAVDRKVIAICDGLGDAFLDEELNKEIHEIAGHGKRASEPTLEKYRQLVIDRLNFEPHPRIEQNPEVSDSKRMWVPRKRAVEYASDGTPRESRMPVDLLDREERVKRIKLEVGLSASRMNSGETHATITEVTENILNNAVSRSTALSLMKDAGIDDGYDFDNSESSQLINVDLNTLGDSNRELFREIINYREGQKSGESVEIEREVDDQIDNMSEAKRIDS